MKRFLFIAVCFLFLTGMTRGQERMVQRTIQYEEIAFHFSSKENILSSHNIALHANGAQVQSKDESAQILSKIINVPLHDAKPFLAIAVIASIKNVESGLFDIQLKYSSMKEGWSDWQHCTREEHGELYGTIAYSLLFIPKEATQIQAQIGMKGKNLLLDSLRIAFISPGEFPGKLDKPKIHPHVKSSAMVTLPEFISRTDWGCPDGQGSPQWSPLQTNVTHLIIHHTATSNNSTDWAAVVRSIWAYHTYTRDWGDIGYNWLVDPTGIIYQGRAWLGDSISDVRGGHFCGVSPDPNGINNNEQTMGVAVMGTFTSIAPASAALMSLTRLLTWKAKDRSIDPTGISYHAPTGLTMYNISGHRDGCATECPGESLYSMIGHMRETVDSLLHESEITISSMLDAGWNIVSLPVGTSLNVSELFPSAVSSSFTYKCGEGYEQSDTLRAGTGYWVKLQSVSEAGVTGKARVSDTLDVGCSWNLIGTLSQNITATSVRSIPEDIISSRFFSYNAQSGYIVSDTIKPFRGYWVNVSSPGKIILEVPPLPGVRK